MAGFDPNPAKKYPMPIIISELAITRRNTPSVQIAHETCIAIFLPRLSATKGMMKNPINDPKNTIACRIVDVLSHSKYG